MLGLDRLLQPRAPMLRVTRGPDIDRRLWLSGRSLTVGSDRGCDLVLGAPGILPRHLTLTLSAQAAGGLKSAAAAKGEAWVYSLEGDALNRLDGALAPRSGPLAAGRRFQLGPLTEIAVELAPVTDDAPAEVQDAARALPFPMADYWAYAAVFCVAAVLGIWGVFAFARDAMSQNTVVPPRILMVETWFADERLWRDDAADTSALASDLQRCLPGAAPLGDARDIVLRTHLLVASGARGRAAEEMRRLDRLLAGSDCAAVRAVRCDIAQLTGGEDRMTCGVNETDDRR